MIVKILQKSATFKGVKYNTDKLANGKGELMKVSGFSALQGISNLRPGDYINYLAAVSAQSSRTKFPQFHAVMSAKGRSYSKEQLTSLAEAWLKEMGYGKQPYLLVFHKDTANNHIHMVSTRVDRNGKKISDKYEKIRAGKVMDKLLEEEDLNKKVKADIWLALSYSFSTRAQFMMILEVKGYSLKLEGKEYRLFQYGKQVETISLDDVDKRIRAYSKDQDRISQLRAIIEKYHAKYSPVLRPVFNQLPGKRDHDQTGYTSKLAEMLKEKFGLQVLFHFKDGKPPYGYTLLDHAKKVVFKGGEIMDLGFFISPDLREEQSVPETQSRSKSNPSNEILLASEPEEELPLEVMSQNNAEPDLALNKPESVAHVYDSDASWDQAQEIELFPQLDINIADDIDDEAILGRNRRRKRKARTNTR